MRKKEFKTMKNAKIITITIQKGGMQKTSIAHNLICGLAKANYKVLAIDLDQQRNLTQLLKADQKKGNIYQVFTNKKSVYETIQHVYRNIHIINGTPNTAKLLQELPTKQASMMILKDQLEQLKHDYDFIIIDTAPNLSILTMNAIISSSLIVIPNDLNILSLIAARELASTIAQLKSLNSSLQAKMLIVKTSPNKKLNKDTLAILQDLEENAKISLFKARIRNSARVNAEQIKGLSIFENEKLEQAPITQDYKKFINELCNKKLYEIIESENK